MGTEGSKSSPAPDWRTPIIVTPIAVVVVLMLILGLLLWIKPAFFNKMLQKCQTAGGMIPSRHLRNFTLDELSRATNNFTTKLGEGGTATVYKATLPHGEIVSVKALKVGYWTNEQVFLHEINLLGRVSHPYLVQLLGFCNEGNQYFLVYEYMPKGALKDHILISEVTDADPRVRSPDLTLPVHKYQIFDTVKDENSALDVVDPVLRGDFIPRQLYLLLNIAEQCIQFMPEKRPTMRRVVHALEKIQRRVADVGADASKSKTGRWR
ncbi:hypothetical protein CBR_g50716 [Chara braunii]|uniref:Protein kinase domain-containing protein n=1 Tax=Chara braunii TaxID=69332 RepID=A0A388K5L4_CHABU|nr:hypothetical protein CBR_g50716 [Chara braunii]|eukprot:GBG65354.1 hypothetical protein CBR_g50716 [Chara braunii]